MAEKKKQIWRDAKSILAQKEKSELLKLIADLYSLNRENKTFIHTRYSTGEKTSEPYRSIISEALYPDVYKNKMVRFSVGKKAISDYFKATKDKSGKFELMVHYIEKGTKFTADYGDMDEKFYYGLESMFKKILIEMVAEPEDFQNRYLPRLEGVVTLAENVGWGYHETIDLMLEEYKDIIAK